MKKFKKKPYFLISVLPDSMNFLSRNLHTLVSRLSLCCAVVVCVNYSLLMPSILVGL